MSQRKRFEGAVFKVLIVSYSNLRERFHSSTLLFRLKKGKDHQIHLYEKQESSSTLTFLEPKLMLNTSPLLPWQLIF